LSPAAGPILQSLGCWNALLACGFLESFGTRAVWGDPVPYENDFIYSQRGNGWRLDRARFEECLRGHAADAAVDIRAGARLLGSERADSSWRLVFRGFECEARFVIDASGRSAAFAVQRGARRLTDDRLAAAIMWFDKDCAGDLLIEAVEHGWWYSAGTPGGKGVAAFMTDVDLIRTLRLSDPARLQSLLASSTCVGLRLRGAALQGPPAIFSANSQRLDQVAGNGWAAAGDAAMTFDPLSSAGILKALRSGKFTSFVAADYLLHGKHSGARYETLAAEEYAAYREAKTTYYRLEDRWPASAFWQRRR
jgi:flavin-dependent dehydrogenase